MKRIITTVLFIVFLMPSQAQVIKTSDTLVISRAEAETLFIDNNLSLLAEKLNIDQAEAQIIQSKLWPNPRLEVGEINLWKTKDPEQLPPISGSWGKTSEITLGLEQLIYTAGKRKKMIEMDQVGVEIAKEYYQDFLRSLKVEFRNSLTQLQFIQNKQKVYGNQLQSLQKLLKAYANQVNQGNISKSEFVRLKASELSFIKELSELQKENNKIQKELKTLMNLPPSHFLKIKDILEPNLSKMATMQLSDLNTMIENRPDVKVALLEEKYSNRKYKYELAQRTPDVTLLANYDRGGNIMNDFVGFGFAIDLPFFSRNQGNIKSAKIDVEKRKYLKEEKQNQAKNEIIQVYQDFIIARQLYESIDDDYENSLNLLLESHQKNFTQRNTSMLEYLDFVEAYIESMTIILEAKKDINEYFEELQYAIGKEL